ncbi:MAG: PilZ domain-containing protein [Terriglobales bacterium]
MNEATKMSPQGSDWTRLLTDPDLVSHIDKLLQTYREVPAEQREAALLQAMREIKEAAVKDRKIQKEAQRSDLPPDASVTREAESGQAGHDQAQAHEAAPHVELCGPEPVDETPPFEPDFFTAESDRRRFQRIKCYVAVEIRLEGSEAPIWGNLANIGRGGCLVETVSSVPAGKALEIGLWVVSGKIWVKGVILSGVASRSASFGVRVKFSQSELSEKEHLREFLKFVESSVRKAQSEKAYVTQLKA